MLHWWDPDDRRLALAMDATTLGQRFTVLAISVVYRGCAIPVAWKVVGAHEKGTWRPHWEALFTRLRGSVPGRLGRARLCRPRPVCPLAVPAYRLCRLASLPAHQSGWLLPRAGPRLVAPAAHRRPAAWPGLARSGDLFQGPAAGVHARGPLGRAPQGGLAHPHRPGPCVGRGLLVLVTRLGRMWVSRCEKWRVARGPHQDDRSGPRTAPWLAIAVATLWVLSAAHADAAPAPASGLPEIPWAADRVQSTRRSRPRLISAFRRGVLTIIVALIKGEGLVLGRLHPEPWPQGTPVQTVTFADDTGDVAQAVA